MRQTVIGLALCALLVLGLWLRTPERAELQHREIFALGTLLQLTLAEDIPTPAMATLQQQLQAFEQRWSVLGDGLLVTLNRQLEDATGAAVPPPLRDGIGAARKACIQSAKLFDPGLGRLVRIWGFDDEANYRSSPPANAAIQRGLRQTRSLCDAQWDGRNLHWRQPGAQLNFGASAKGRAVGMIAAQLRAAGIRNAIINAGGDLMVLGQHPQRPWRIGIRHPRPDQHGPVLASITLEDGEALFTSGDYERYFEHDGQRYHHILDPRTGWPAGLSQSATVLHTDPEWADAASTALFVAGPEHADALMQRMGVTHYLLRDSAGKLHLSDAMRDRLDAP